MPNKQFIPYLILLCAIFLIASQMNLPYLLKQGLIVLYVIAYFGTIIISRKMNVRDRKQ